MNLGSILGVGVPLPTLFCRFDHPEWWSLAKAHEFLDVDSQHPQIQIFRGLGAQRLCSDHKGRASSAESVSVDTECVRERRRRASRACVCVSHSVTLR